MQKPMSYLLLRLDIENMIKLQKDCMKIEKKL